MRMRARICCAVLLGLVARQSAALEMSNYYSPKNRERPARHATRYIILHTTEGPTQGSLNKVRENGETHFFVDPAGHVYRIIDRKRIATHAGRSMWNGTRNLDNYAIGIEVAGYHNRDITKAQYRALNELIAQLQKTYGISDGNVLCHAMVAYGAPNRWHRTSHRGRKRCGMLFARRPVRLKLGLDRQPLYDPDVKAGRLVVGDPHLAAVLYGNAGEQEKAAVWFASADADVVSSARSAWDIAGEKYKSPETIYTLPDGRKLRGDEIREWKKLPPGTRVVVTGDSRGNEFEDVKEIGVDGETAKDIAGAEYNSETTIYFLPDGSVKRGNELAEAKLQALRAKTRMLVGYAWGGCITARKSAFDICGKRWNFPSTFYRLPDGTIKAGSMLDENSIPKNTLVFFRN